MTEPKSREGTQFGPYRLLRLIGKGGMGEVYEAQDTVKDRIVALKRFMPLAGRSRVDETWWCVTR
jgi:serine/threonine protein kinase